MASAEGRDLRGDVEARDQSTRALQTDTPRHLPVIEWLKPQTKKTSDTAEKRGTSKEQ